MKTFFLAAMLVLCSATYAQQAAQPQNFSIPCANAVKAETVFNTLLDKYMEKNAVPQSFFEDVNTGSKRVVLQLANGFVKLELDGQHTSVRQSAVNAAGEPISTDK